MLDALARTHPTEDADLAHVQRDPLALAITAWRDSKHGKSGSARTRDTYTTTLADFRAALGRVGLDLDGETTAQAMERAGATVSMIQARLGHRNLATTGRYLTHLSRIENIHADALARLFTASCSRFSSLRGKSPWRNSGVYMNKLSKTNAFTAHRSLFQARYPLRKSLLSFSSVWYSWAKASGPMAAAHAA